MSTRTHKPSGAKIAPFFQPVNIVEFGNPGQPTDIIVHNGRLLVYDATGNTTIDGGIVQTQGLVVGAKSWAHDVPFIATDGDTITWANTGKVYFGDGTSTEIDAGTTGNMGAKTYVYYNGTSTLQTTTTITTALGNSVKLIAILEPQAVGKATLKTLNQAGNTIHADKIVAGLITTSQLNFVPVADTNVIASINASAEGIQIDADNIKISGSTTFSSGYDPSGKVATFYQDGVPTAISAGDLWFDTNDGDKPYRATAAGDDAITAGEWEAIPDANKLNLLGGAYNSAGSGARVRIFPDANTGIVVIDDATGEVFKVLVGGADVGDVIIGDFAGDKGMKWDKSAATFTIRGILNADDIVGGTLSVDRIAANSIVAGKIGTDLTDGNISSINFDNISASNIDADNIKANAITAGKIAVGAIDAGNLIVNGIIDTDQLAAQAVTAIKIEGHTITANEIAVGTITATEIAASTITADELNIGTLSAISANIGTITAGTLESITRLNIGASSAQPFYCYGTYITTGGALSLGGDVDMNTHSIQEISYTIYVESSANPSIDYGFYAYASGGTLEMRMRVNSDAYNISRSAV